MIPPPRPFGITRTSAISGNLREISMVVFFVTPHSPPRGVNLHAAREEREGHVVDGVTNG